MDAFARADLEMVTAVGADLEILVELLVENHVGAFGALGPKAFGNVALAGFGGAELGLFGEGSFGAARRRSDGRFDRVQTESFFVERGGRHNQLSSIIHWMN